MSGTDRREDFTTKRVPAPAGGKITQRATKKTKDKEDKDKVKDKRRSEEKIEFTKETKSSCSALLFVYFVSSIF